LDKDSSREDGLYEQSAYDEYDPFEKHLRPQYLNDNNEDSSPCSDFSAEDEGDINNLPSINGSCSASNESLMDFVNSLINPNENGMPASTSNYTLPASLSSVTETLNGCSQRLAKITDFSPEWDYTDGGAKILIMGPDFHSGLNYYCLFDQVEVPAELVQDGVIRCRVPNYYKPGVVSFCVTRGNYNLFSEVYNFEYRTREVPSELMSGNDRTFKLRIIERLERLEREVNSGNAVDPIQLTDNIMDSLNTNLDLAEEQLEQVFVKLLINLMDKLDNCDTVNAQDQDGLTLLHYACALRYHVLASTLVHYGVNVNIQDKSGNTPFHVAMKNRDQNMIKILVDYVDLNKNVYDQIDVTSKSNCNFSPMIQGKTIVDGLISGMDQMGLQLEDTSSPLLTGFSKLKEREGSAHSSPRTPHAALKSRQGARKEIKIEEGCSSPILPALRDFRVRRVEKAEDDSKKRAAKARDNRVAEKRK